MSSRCIVRRCAGVRINDGWVEIVRLAIPESTALDSLNLNLSTVWIPLFRSTCHDVSSDTIHYKLEGGDVILKIDVMCRHVVTRDVVDVIAIWCLPAFVRLNCVTTGNTLDKERENIAVEGGDESIDGH